MADDKLQVEGKIIKVYRGSTFDVELDNGMVVNCTISGKLRMNKIRLVQEDTVIVALSPYDLKRGIIIWRNK